MSNTLQWVIVEKLLNLSPKNASHICSLRDALDLLWECSQTCSMRVSSDMPPKRYSLGQWCECRENWEGDSASGDVVAPCVQEHAMTYGVTEVPFLAAKVVPISWVRQAQRKWGNPRSFSVQDGPGVLNTSPSRWGRVNVIQCKKIGLTRYSII